MIACATFTFSYICSIFSFQVKNSDQVPIERCFKPISYVLTTKIGLNKYPFQMTNPGCLKIDQEVAITAKYAAD